jgi:dihydroorotate dehydrogenase
MERFAPLADYLALNVSSPNTPDLRQLQGERWLRPLLESLAAHRRMLAQRRGRPLPLLLKLSPDLEPPDLERAVAAANAAGIDGIIATNTTTSRSGLRSPLAAEEGGLSGAALSRRSTEIVRRLHELGGGRLPLVACGGVMGAEDARAKLDAGATLIQLYTGLVYEGPGLVRRILREL